MKPASLADEFNTAVGRGDVLAEAVPARGRRSSRSASNECPRKAPPSGRPHHTVLTTQVDRESLEDLATIAGVELAWIDGSSDTAGFTRELRWNDTYHRLGGR